MQEKNYQLNEPQYAYVGAPMVRVKEYYTIRNIQDAAVASNDFTVSPTVGFSKTGRKGSSYKIIGTTDYKGRTYRVLQMERYGLMLDEDGTPINSVIDLSSGLHNVFVPSFSISPPDTTFNVLSDMMVDKGKPFTYYELLYSGIDGNSLRIAYHEYSPDNLVRPAFVQELTYPVFQSELTFRNLKLEILSSDSQQVWFMVVDDRGASAASTSSVPTSPSTSGPSTASGIGLGVHRPPFRRRRRRAPRPMPVLRWLTSDPSPPARPPRVVLCSLRRRKQEFPSSRELLALRARTPRGWRPTDYSCLAVE